MQNNNYNGKIGEAAGKIWKALNGNGSQTVTVLRNKTRLSNDALSMGLGWLAREDKLNFNKKGKSISVSLK